MEQGSREVPKRTGRRNPYRYKRGKMTQEISFTDTIRLSIGTYIFTNFLKSSLLLYTESELEKRSYLLTQSFKLVGYHKEIITDIKPMRYI